MLKPVFLVFHHFPEGDHTYIQLSEHLPAQLDQLDKSCRTVGQTAAGMPSLQASNRRLGRLHGPLFVG
jgi:hypothetical protein